MTESELSRKVMKMLKKDFPDIWAYKTSDRFQSGIPDILLCKDGHLWAIELKRPGLDATKLQRYVLNSINTAGGSAAVCHSVQEVRNYLTKLE